MKSKDNWFAVEAMNPRDVSIIIFKAYFYLKKIKQPLETPVFKGLQKHAHKMGILCLCFLHFVLMFSSFPAHKILSLQAGLFYRPV